MEPTSATLDDAVIVAADVERHVSYLRIALDAPPGDGWVRSADLLADGARLLRSIEETQAGRGAPDLQVTASLWFQAYAFRVALPVVAPFALGLPGLSGDPAATHIRIARSRPAAVAVTDRSTRDRTAGDAADDLLGAHLAPMVEAIAGTVTIGRRLLWGNAAASVAAVLRAIEGAPHADRPAVRARAEALLERAEPWLSGLGRFDLVGGGGDGDADRAAWRWRRTNCCLYDRCEGASRCEDCSLDAPSQAVAS